MTTWKGRTDFPTDDGEFTNAFAIALLELEAEHAGRFILDTSITDIVVLIGLLQLALRHPDARRLETAKRARTTVQNLIAVLGRDYPIIAKGLNRGWEEFMFISEEEGK